MPDTPYWILSIAVSTGQNRTLMYETRQTTIPFPSRLNGYYCEEKKGSYRPQFSEAYFKALRSIPQKEKDPKGFTLPCFLNNVYFDNALVDLGVGVSVMPLSTLLNLICELVTQVDNMPEDIKVPLILGRPFLSTARAKIDVYKRKITLRVREERIVFTRALWDYWKIGGDEIEVSDDESSDLEEYRSDKEETAKNFKIETNVFKYKTPLCLAFNEFNYLLKVDPDLLTKDIIGFKTYEDYKDDWIYEWNKDIPWVDEKPWTEAGVWTKPKAVKHTCKPFNYKTGCSKWPTCSWKEDGYCNGGNLPDAYHIGNSLPYQDLEWYEALEDSKLKDEDLRNKAIMKGDYENETHGKEHELCAIKTRKVPVCQINRYKMIKYSFNDEEEYVDVKEDEYDNLTITSEEACRAYQEIFRMIDKGWMVARTETLEAKNIDEYGGWIYNIWRS
ncbi:hypothetical protein Tco_0377742 [Tanacetum coccineum]